MFYLWVYIGGIVISVCLSSLVVKRIENLAEVILMVVAIIFWPLMLALGLLYFLYNFKNIRL